MLWVEVADMDATLDKAGTLAVWDEEEDAPAWAYELRREFRELVAKMTPRPQPTFLSVEQVAERWAMSTKSVRRYIEAGELPSFLLGHSRRVRLSDVEAFEEARAARYLQRKGAAA